jgi:hypothetical protein
VDRHHRGLKYLVHRRGPLLLIVKICANKIKKIGEERRGDYPEAGISLEYEEKTNLKYCRRST